MRDHTTRVSRSIAALMVLFFVTFSSTGAAGFDAGPLEKAVREAEAGLPARVGVFVLDTENGSEWGHRQDERFPLNSTFKAFLCAALLHQAAEGAIDPMGRVEISTRDLVPYSPVTETRVGSAGMTLLELCEATVTTSDNTAANLVLDRIGGPEAFTGFMRSIGDGITRLDRREPELNEGRPGDNRDTTTPAAAAASLKMLLLGETLDQNSKLLLTSWLEGNRVGASTLRAGLPEGWRIADKTGAGGFGSRSNIAAVWPEGRKPVVIAVYITETEASFEDRNAAIAEIGRALFTSLR